MKKTENSKHEIFKKNCLHCKHLKVKYTGTGLLYLCNGIVLADEDEEFKPKNDCKKFELKKSNKKINITQKNETVNYRRVYY